MNIRRSNKRFFPVLLFLACLLLLTGCGSTLKKGTKALEDGEYEEAITLFTEAAADEDDETAADAYVGLGMAYYELADYESALSAFEQGLSLGAEKTVQLYNLCAVCALQGEDYETALEHIQTALALAETTGYTSGDDAADTSSDADSSGDGSASGDSSDDDNSSSDSSDEDPSADSLIQELKYNEIICYEQLGDWENAKAKMQEYREAYPDDDSVEKEAEFLETR